MKKRYRKAIFCVVYKKEKEKILYLLLHRKHHWRGWEFTKGGIKKGESKIHAVKREVREESGNSPLHIRRYNISGKYSYKHYLQDRPHIAGQTFSLFSAEIKGKKIKFDKLEHDNFIWLDFNKAFKKLTWPNQKRCLKIVNSFISSGPAVSD